MKLRIAPFLMLAGALGARAQSAPAVYQNFCQVGGQVVKTQGASSTTTVQASFPKCQVDVYLSGTSTRAALFSDAVGTQLPNPFTAKTDGSFVFFATPGQAYDVVLSGGTPNSFPQAFALVDVYTGGTGGGSGGANISGTPYTLAMFDPAKQGKNVTDSPVSISADGTTEQFVTTQPYAVNRVHGAQFAWNQIENEAAPAGQRDVRFILRDNGAVQLEEMSGDGPMPTGYGEGIVWQFTPSSTVNKFGGSLLLNLPTTIQQELAINSNPGDNEQAFSATVNDLAMGWNHGTSGAFGMTPFLAHESITANGFHGMWDFQFSSRANAGDTQVFNLGLSDRGGGTEPSDEEQHVWRVEHQNIQPYFGLYQTSGVSATGHPQLSMIPQFNGFDLGPENPLVDVSTRQSMNITAVAPQIDGVNASAMITTDDTHGVSTTGTILNDNDAGQQDMSTPITVTMHVAWTGSDPLHTPCVAWTAGAVGNGHSHSPEKIWPTATVNNGDGTWNVTAEILHSHFANDHFSCGGTVGRWVDFADSDIYGYNAYYQIEYHELVLESPAANQERVAHSAFGGMSTFAHTTAAKRYVGTYVLDAQIANGGYSPVVQNSELAPSQGDQLAQFGTMEQGYLMWLENEELLDPYAGFGMFQLNMQNSVFDNSRSQVFNLALTPDLMTFLYPIAAGPFLTQAFAPGTGHQGGTCVGQRYEICVSQTNPGDEYDIFRTQYQTGGISQLHVSGTTKRLSWLGVGSGFDVQGNISTAMNAQIQGTGEWSALYDNIGVPGLLASAVTYDDGTTKTLKSRCGFAGENALTSVGGGGFLSQWRVNAAMDAAVRSATFCQLEGSHYVVIGNDSDTSPVVDMNPVDGSMRLGHGPMIVPQSNDSTHHWKLQVSSAGAVSAVQVD